MSATRQTPTSTTHPTGVSGDSYATKVAEEVGALWEYSFVPAEVVSGTNDLVLTSSVPLSLLSPGNSLSFLAPATNTGAMTLNVDGTGVKALLSASGGVVTSGQVVAGTLYPVRYDGAAYRLSPDVPNIGTIIANYTSKASPVSADLVAIADTENSNAPRKVTIAQLLATGGAPPREVVVEEVSFTNVSQVILTNFDYSLYDRFKVELDYLVRQGGSNYTLPYILMSLNSGASWLSSYATGVGSSESSIPVVGSSWTDNSPHMGAIDFTFRGKESGQRGLIQGVSGHPNSSGFNILSFAGSANTTGTVNALKIERGGSDLFKGRYRIVGIRQ